MIVEIFSFLLTQNINPNYIQVEFTQQQYLQIQQVSTKINSLDRNLLPATVDSYNFILGIEGVLIDSDPYGFNTYRWQDNNDRVIEGVFRDRELVRWKSIGF
jgi:hypothetical protein